MSSPVLEQAVSLEGWLAADAGRLERVEVSGGRFVIRRVGGHPYAQHLDWYARDPSRAARWAGVTGAAGDTPLVVQAPRPFRIVPNRLFGPGRIA